MRAFITFLIIIIIVVLAVFGFYQGWFSESVEVNNNLEDENGDETSTTTDQENDNNDNADSESVEVIGSSVNGHDIPAHHFGSGSKEVLFVGGIHGGYSWNTALLSYRLIDYLEDNSDVVPEGVKVTIIPALNPDGLEEVFGVTEGFLASDAPSQQETVPGRFNGNEIDLNRNFDCNWQSTGTWQTQPVDAGSEPFSEPETRALRDYVEQNNPSAVVVYYSAAGGVYTSSCDGSTLTEAEDMMNVYADASGYSAEGLFEAYQITGDAVDWLAKIGIPGISVLLETHSSVEFDQNLEGVEAVLNHFAE